MSAITEERIASLCKATNGKPDWYSTRRKVTAAERQAGLDWDGAAKRHVPRRIGRLVQFRTGTWARERGGIAGLLTAAECAAAGVAPGPGNV